MARIAEGWKLRRKRDDAPWEVRFTLGGRRYEIGTGERDRGAAAVEAAKIYASALDGSLAGVAPRPDTTSKAPLSRYVADWLASLATTHDPETRTTYEGYARRWLGGWASAEGAPVAGWASLAEVTTRACADYARARLAHVTRSTVQKELSALRGLLLWADEAALLAELPSPPRLPKRAAGTRAAGGRAPEATPLSPAEVAAILEQLPEWSSRRADRYPVRAYFEVAAETGLRPATLQGLRYPDHWRRGATTLTIPAELDKSRWGREVPLSARALAALHAVAPEGGGLIFGVHPYHEGWLRPAATRAGLPLDRARRVVPYDLRHARITGLLAAGASLPGVQHLVGHQLATTTDRYTHPGPEHARAALRLVAPPAGHSGGILGVRGVAGYRCDGSRDTTPEPFFAIGAKRGT